MLLERDEYPRFRETLRRLGYSVHRGPRAARQRELEAWVAVVDRSEQIHVQTERGAGEYVAVYAHTEPAGYGLAHVLAAVLDSADFRRGARVLLRDLSSAGWEVERYRPRL